MRGAGVVALAALALWGGVVCGVLAALIHGPWSVAVGAAAVGCFASAVGLIFEAVD